MIEAGFSEKEAMTVSGHKTRAVFDRYHIVSSRRLKELGQKMEAHLTALESSVLDNGARQNLEVQENVENNGEPGGTRTRDHRIKSAFMARHVSCPCNGMKNLRPIIRHWAALVSPLSLPDALPVSEIAEPVVLAA